MDLGPPGADHDKDATGDVGRAVRMLRSDLKTFVERLRIPAVLAVVCLIPLFGTTTRAAMAESPRITTLVSVRCTPGSRELEAGLSALLRDHLEAIAEIDVVDGHDLALAARATGDTVDGGGEILRRGGIDSSLELVCAPRGSQIEVTATLRFSASGKTINTGSMDIALRTAGHIPFQVITTLFSRALDKGLLPGSIYTPADQSLLSRLVRPQYGTLLAYGRALLVERTDPMRATALLREALVIDPDFYPAYARLYYTCYVLLANPYPAEGDITTQARVRLNSVEGIWIARAFYDLAVSVREKGWYNVAEVYYKRSLFLLKSGGKEKSLLSAMSLARLGESYLSLGNNLLAMYYIQTAREMMEGQGLAGNIFNRINLVRLCTIYSMDGKPDVALWLIDRADRLAGGGADSLFSALTRANAGTALWKKGDTEKAVREYRRSRNLLKEKNITHSLMYASLLLNEAHALRSTGDIRNAEDSYTAVTTHARILGLENTQIYVDALSGLGTTSTARGDAYAAQNYYRIAYQMQLRVGVRQQTEFVSVSQIPTMSQLGFTEEEAAKVASFTGAFSYDLHSRAVQARTYAGRLDDTNVLLKDLLDVTKNSDPILADLRTKLLGYSVRPGGEGVHFVDIGPAIANLTSPGVTAVSVARDFPAMSVIALDLPAQVEIFRTIVDPSLRHRVLDFPNFHVISGDGVVSLKDQFGNADLWLEPRKGRRSIRPGDPVVLRAANSIDIYISWPRIEESMIRIGADFYENPVLYFFNRSLLFKPANSGRFSIIGTISKAGFDHMYETFDRGGEGAYTLIQP